MSVSNRREQELSNVYKTQEWKAAGMERVEWKGSELTIDTLRTGAGRTGSNLNIYHFALAVQITRRTHRKFLTSPTTGIRVIRNQQSPL
jgi:hypothetical protein